MILGLLIALLVVSIGLNILIFVIGFRSGFRYCYWSIKEVDVKLYLPLWEILGAIMQKKPRVEPEQIRKQRFWKELWKKALEQSKEIEDPRYPLLLRYQKKPEQILRKLNIICANDLDREFK